MDDDYAAAQVLSCRVRLAHLKPEGQPEFGALVAARLAPGRVRRVGAVTGEAEVIHGAEVTGGSEVIDRAEVTSGTEVDGQHFRADQRLMLGEGSQRVLDQQSTSAPRLGRSRRIRHSCGRPGPAG